MKLISLYLMAGLYILAGIIHFIYPKPYLAIIPHFLPAPLLLVYVSGAIEILLGLLLIPEITRKWAAWGIILLLIFIFPANIQMLVNYWQTNNPYVWVALARLPLQFFLIRWAWTFTR